AAHLDAFGRNIGIAFQIQDDLLDTFGDPEKFGKKTGGDIARNKKTFLLLKALESATPALRQELMALYSETSPALESAKIERVKAIFSELQTAASAQAAKTDYQQRAFQHLAAIDAPEEGKVVVRDFANWLFSRDV
ncbi:MAG TPA: polyprenyl synthetase family protein, partial [Saprospiraceae bacterium]|nr:polyprenyl synthetase family protein [Saprospiraceae bacterium]